MSYVKEFDFSDYMRSGAKQKCQNSWEKKLLIKSYFILLKLSGKNKQ